MAIVNTFTFNDQQGAIVSDEESWHLRLRKTHHSEYLLNLLPAAVAKVCKLKAIYGGVGNPAYHYEVVHRTRQEIARRWRENDEAPATLLEVSRTVLEAFHGVSRRYSDEKLRFLFGFGLDDANAGRVVVDGEPFPVEQEPVRKRALKIANLEEGFEDAPLTPPNHACIAGWDPENGFKGFVLKQENGVLSFQSGGFDSLGAGRYAGGVSFQKTLGRMTLEQRRKGVGFGQGLAVLLTSIIEAGEHFGQVGGTYNMYIIDGREDDLGCRLRYVHGDEARLAVEIARGMRSGFLAQAKAWTLLARLVGPGGKVNEVEKAMFSACSSPRAFDLALRGYKVMPTSGAFKANTFDT
jgi:hypothetical protein